MKDFSLKNENESMGALWQFHAEGLLSMKYLLKLKTDKFFFCRNEILFLEKRRTSPWGRCGSSMPRVRTREMSRHLDAAQTSAK